MTTLERDPVVPAQKAPPPMPRPRPQRNPLQRLLDLLSSMRLTVVLLLLLAALTFFGTLAQTQDGIYYVQKEYFESWFVLIPMPIGPGFPLPGALPVMGLLFVNLMCGGIARMRWRARNVGVLISHFGIALLLIAGFVKLEMSYAGHMSLYEGDTGNAIRSMQEWELALMRKDGDGVVERTLPGSTVERASGDRRLRIAGDGLPFELDVHHFFEHCLPTPPGPNFKATAPLVDGLFLSDSPRLVQPTKERDQKLAGCYVTVLGKDGTSEQAILWAGDMLRIGGPMRPFTFEMDGQTWGLQLRHKLWTLPFDVRLDTFKKSDHPGSAMVRDYSSYVTVKEPDGGERAVHIYMNEPLRKQGYVFFQTSWGPQNGMGGPYFSTFEVASNPSDKWPEYACYIIAVGLLIHFLSKLGRFISAEGRRRSQDAVA